MEPWPLTLYYKFITIDKIKIKFQHTAEHPLSLSSSSYYQNYLNVVLNQDLEYSKIHRYGI